MAGVSFVGLRFQVPPNINFVCPGNGRIGNCGPEGGPGFDIGFDCLTNWNLTFWSRY